MLSGCLELSAGTCSLDGPTTVGVWVDRHAATPLQVRIDGEAVPTTASAVAGGTRLSFEVPSAAHTITVETSKARWSEPPRWTVHWRPPATWTARGLVTELGLDAASIRLRTLADAEQPWLSLRALNDLRRLEHSRDQWPAMLAVGHDALALARALDAPEHQADLLVGEAVHLLETVHDLDAARPVVEALAALRQASPRAEMHWHYARGLLARRMGEFDTAADHFTSARILGEKLDAPRLDAAEQEAVTLADLGRADEADAASQRAMELARDTACSRTATTANNIGWARLVLATDDPDAEDPRPLFREGLAAFDRCPSSPWDRESLLVDLALAELTAHQPTDALGWLAQLESISPDLQPWVDEASHRAAAALDPRMEPSLLERPRPTGDPQLRWNQHVRRGDALARWGFHALAEDSYRAAEALLSKQAERVGTGTGGELYLAGRSASLHGLVDSLLQQGQVSQAACAVRLARAREVARLDRAARISTTTLTQRTAWADDVAEIVRQRNATLAQRASLRTLSDAERAQARAKLQTQVQQTRRRFDEALGGLGLQPTPQRCEDLRAPAPGEVLLVGDATMETPLAFAITPSRVQVAPLHDLSSLEVLADARRISVIEVGTHHEPLHGRPWRDYASLLDLAPVAYSLDLPPRQPPSSAPTRALVVADSRRDLAQAQQEADAVVGKLRARTLHVQDVRGDAATRDTVTAALSSTDLFHYAGHGAHEGLSGWDSALLLADDQRLGVRDVFLLPAVPRGVVLTGCQTAAPTPDTIGGGMNLARAFILSGARWVVATDARVDDRHAAALGAALHDVELVDGPTRLRRAILALRATDPEAPWLHFRVLIP